MLNEYPTIMIIDDDNAFRQMLIRILKVKKYRCVEARSTEEADAVFSPGEVDLAIVDYRLLGGDGMTWITKIREQGHNMPVIFVSGTACDMGTFNRLRNILKVSLIARKPIIPEVFLQQIEVILPNHAIDSPVDAEGIADLINCEPESESGNDSGTDDHMTPGNLLKQLTQIRAKLEVKSAIKVAQSNYIEEMEREWRHLSALLMALKEAPDDGQILMEVQDIAHRIAGTAGSLGLPQMSEVASNIEVCLRALRLADAVGNDDAWSGIYRAMSMGDAAVAIITGSREPLDLEDLSRSKVLLVTHDQPLSINAELVTTLNMDVASNIFNALNKVQRATYDAAVVDLDTLNKESTIQLCQKIRTAAESTIPLALIGSGPCPFSDGALLYMGISQMLDRRGSANDLADACAGMIRARLDQKPRIMMVDDDKVLTSFMSAVLQAHGMEVRSLNSPILTIDELDEFRPDLLLLDVNMPGLTGYEVCRAVRENYKWKDIPIVFLTGKTTPEARTAAFQSGANDFLTKPVITEELLARCKSQLGSLCGQGGRLSKDEVTGLFREEVFIATSERILRDFDSAPLPLTLALITIDNVEDIRITQGSDSLQHVVKSLGSLLMTHFKPEDLRGKLGYDSFALLVTEQNKATLSEAMEMLQSAFSDSPFLGVEGAFNATFTAGLADTTDDGQTFYALLCAAHRRRRQAARQQPSGSIAMAG